MAQQAEPRVVGKTEANWVAAVEGGTGITITSILFHAEVSAGDVKRALCVLLARHPRLRSLIVKEDREFVFRTPEEVFVRLIETDLSAEAEAREGSWIESVTERELNAGFSKDYPVAVFQPKLFRLPGARGSLLVLRLHAAAADMTSAATMVREVVGAMRGAREAGGVEAPLPAMEEAIPAGQANKPFWARGVDVLGYGMSSRRHACLPFEETGSARASKLIRAGLSAAATSSLLKDCENREVSVYGVTIAAALKAVAAYKRVGARGEHYAVTVLMQCRSLLEPPLPDSAIGFYHSALLRTIHTTEPEPFWEFASRCTQDLSAAVAARKHFTDMADLNGLMEQAMRFPALTPSGSLRTSTLSTMMDPVAEADFSEDVQDYLSCSSTHGIGPCLALFPFMRGGALRFSFVYSSPLFSRQMIQSLIDSILFYLSEDE